MDTDVCIDAARRLHAPAADRRDRAIFDPLFGARRRRAPRGLDRDREGRHRKKGLGRDASFFFRPPLRSGTGPPAVRRRRAPEALEKRKSASRRTGKDDSEGGELDVAHPQTDLTGLEDLVGGWAGGRAGGWVGGWMGKMDGWMDG